MVKKTKPAKRLVASRKLGVKVPSPLHKAKPSIKKAALERLKKKPVQPKQSIEKNIASRVAKAEGIAAHERSYQKLASKIIRDIAPLPFDKINWDRRLACEYNLQLFNETYLSDGLFLDPWGAYHIELIKALEHVTLHSGMKAMAVPRGGGKTALCRAAVIWGTLYGHTDFCFFLGSRQDKAQQTLQFVKLNLYRNPLLIADFPEVCWPIVKAEGSARTTGDQIHHGIKTYLDWSSGDVRFPSLVFGEDEAKIFPENFLVRVPNYDNSAVNLHGYIDGVPGKAYTTRNAAAIIRCEGIEGSIRGDAEVHPLLLTQPRPSLILLDDIQKDVTAKSPTACDAIEELIDGAIKLLPGPGKAVSVIMPCTAIRENDVSDRYLDRMKKPQYQGSRFGMVSHWPDGITDDDISDTTEAGKLWSEYANIRLQSIREHGDIRHATSFYLENRKVMDEGFQCTWEHRYNKLEKYGYNREVSPQQHAMNLRLDNPTTFRAECQNRPKSVTAGGTMLITVAGLMERYTKIPRLVVPYYCNWVVSYIDIQDEIFYYTTVAAGDKFTGCVIDYGYWPTSNRLNPTYPHNKVLQKSAANKYRELTNCYYQAHPHMKPDGYRRTKTEDNKKAPLQAKIYYGLSQIIPILHKRTYMRDDGLIMQPSAIGVDAHWGLVTNTVYQFIREYGSSQIHAMHGKFVGAATKSFDEYQTKPGQYVGNHCLVTKTNPNQECQFSIPTINVDTNFWKSQVHNLFAVPLGSDSSLQLFEVPDPFDHEMYARHVAGSEYAEPVKARNRVIDEWHSLPGNSDNEYLDCTTGCLCLLSLSGATLVEPQVKPKSKAPLQPASIPREYRKPAQQSKQPARSMRDVWLQKRGG